MTEITNIDHPDHHEWGPQTRRKIERNREARACAVHSSLWPDEMTTCLFDQAHGDGPPECQEDDRG